MLLGLRAVIVLELAGKCLEPSTSDLLVRKRLRGSGINVQNRVAMLCEVRRYVM